MWEWIWVWLRCGGGEEGNSVLRYLLLLVVVPPEVAPIGMEWGLVGVVRVVPSMVEAFRCFDVRWVDESVCGVRVGVGVVVEG